MTELSFEMRLSGSSFKGLNAKLRKRAKMGNEQRLDFHDFGDKAKLSTEFCKKKSWLK